MTDRLHRSRVLPEGYQFGDARKPRIAIRFVQQWDITADLHPTRIYDWHARPGWNVIEGDTFTTDHDCGDETDGV